MIWAAVGTAIGPLLPNPRARLAFNWLMAGLLMLGRTRMDRFPQSPPVGMAIEELGSDQFAGPIVEHVET
jgi:hypothetical protein